MQVTVTGRHYEVTPALRSYVDVRLNRLTRYTDKIQTAHVTLSAEKHRHRAEIVLRTDGKELTSKEMSEDMYSALDQVSDKLEKQLRRLKRRRTAARKDASVRGGKRCRLAAGAGGDCRGRTGRAGLRYGVHRAPRKEAGR